MVVSLWNDLATGVGQELLDIADKSPIVAIKSLKVGDFQGKTGYSYVCFFLTEKVPACDDVPNPLSGVSLSALSRSVVSVNPDIIEAKKLRNW